MKIFGLKFTKSSFNGHVEDADLSQMAVDTTKPMPKILFQGPVQFQTTGSPGATGTSIYTHNLGYQPQFLLFMEVSYGTPRVKISNSRGIVSSGFSSNHSFVAGSTTTQIRCFQRAADTNLYNGYLYVFYDSMDEI